MDDKCQYCEDGKEIAWDMQNDAVAIVTDGELHLLAGGDWWAKIKFCPMCGRKLDD